MNADATLNGGKLVVSATLTGGISVQGNILSMQSQAELIDNRVPLVASFSENNLPVSCNLINDLRTGEVYSGAYTVTPSTSEIITLETDGKQMTNNVTIYPLTLTYTPNDAGGMTVTIGG